MFLLILHSNKDLVRFFLYIFTLPTFWVSASTVPLEYGEFKLFQTPVTYVLNTSVSITDENEGGRSIGYRITAIVGLEPIWSDQETDFLLKFHLESPKLYIVGKKGEVAGTSWAALGESSFFARLTHGAVQTAYLDERDPMDLLNYKKSIVSLFQFRAIDGENKETDVSGTCDVVYQSTSPTTIHKIKTRCSEDESQSWSRRATYSLSRGLDALARVHARERARLGGELDERAALAAACELRLALLSAGRARAPLARRLDQALQAIPAHLKPQALTLHPVQKKWEWEEDLDSALSELRALAGGAGAGEGGEGAGEGGEERSARAVLRALPALAAADQRAVRRVLDDDQYYPVLPMLYRLVGQSGSGAALAAAASQLQLAAEDAPRALAAQLLAGAARAERAQPAARAALLQLARTARAPHVAHAALLAAAAQARSAPAAARAALRDLVVKELARCKEDSCRIVRLHALANLAAPDTADALLEHARRGSSGAALAALDALEELGALRPDLIAALQDIATASGRALEVRASALDLALRRAPERLPALAAALRGAPAELRRVLWQRVRQLRADVRRVSALDRSWHAQANAGTSSVLTRATGWRLAPGAARLHSTQLAAAGALRRGIVALKLHPQEEELLAVEVWTRGLEALAGGAADAAPEGGARGGLRLRVGGVHQPGLELFDGQAELLGHVWAGAGSSATPVLRGESARGGLTRAAPLLAGCWLGRRAARVLAFAVDAQAQVSLWSRTARAALELRAVALAESRLALAAPGAGALAAAAGSAPRMALDAHVDFYDGVALCVRAALAPHAEWRSVRAEHAGRAARAGSTRAARWARAGRTLSLGADNDRACRHVAVEDHP